MKDAVAVYRRWVQTGVALTLLGIAVALLLPAIERARENARRTQSRYNLKQVGLAFHNYHDTHSCFPPGGIFDAQGRGFHGWPLMCWPFMESTPVYNQIDSNQPWDTLFNADFFRRSPPWMTNPSITENGLPGGFGLAHYSANARLLGTNSSAKLSDVPSTSEMFLAAELGGDFVPWGCPYNWRLLTTLDAQPHVYGRPEGIGGHFLMVDGSVRWIAPDISAGVLVALRGPDLASGAAVEIPIRRSVPFPFPSDAWKGTEISFGEKLRCFGKRNVVGDVVYLDLSDSYFKSSVRVPGDDDLRRLVKFPHLKILKASGDFSDEGVYSLVTLKSLEHLSISGSEITPRGLESLGEQLPSCRIVHIRSAR